MSNTDPFAPPPEQQQRRAAWPVLTMFAALWLVGCAFAFALMMGWL